MSITRSDNDKIIAGVCGGIANSLGVEALWIRLALVIFVLLGGSGIAVYALLWLFLPRSTGGSAFEDIRRDFRRS